MSEQQHNLLTLNGISKIYPAVVANDDISLQLKKGEIHAVLGENGAGKSTLMKIIYGVTHPDKGHIEWEGQRVDIKSPSEARKLGIGMVFQHFSLFETLTVVENVALALDDKPNLKTLAKEIKEVSTKYGLPIDPHHLVHALSVGERQRVEIVRCLLQNPKLLIMDEPTSVLTPSAVQTLFKTLRQLAEEGCSILYISHKLDEIKELCHEATVLRNGKVTGTCIPADETAKSMASLMIGKQLPVCEKTEADNVGDVRLALKNLNYKSADPFATELENINLEVHAGEIIGIAGVSGNGQQELLRAISGEQRLDSQEGISICGENVALLSPQQRRKLGFCFVPEERLGRGAVPTMSLSSNILLTAHHQGMLNKGMIAFKKVKEFSNNCIEHFNVKCGGSDASANSLSGGNLQKFIMGREILQKPAMLVVSQPTWGVDVGAAAFIRQQLIDLRDQGTAILVLSEELDELFEITDQLAVIADGKLSPLTKTSQTSIDEIGVWMSGLWPTDTKQEDSHVATA